MQVRFATQSYRHPSLPISAQRAINCYAEGEPPDAKTQIALLYSPGITSFAACGNGPVRGMHFWNGLLYVVSGPTLYSVTTAGVVTALGGAVSGTGPVRMEDNGLQLCMVNGEHGYIYTPSIGFVLITSIAFHAAKTVTFFDQYFVFDQLGTAQFFISAQLDGLTYNGLDFASAESHPGNVQSLLNQQQTLLIFCDHAIETWYDAGANDFPFRRYDGATIERGTAAALSAIKEDNGVFFLGDDLVFYRLDGIALRRISTHAIEAEWMTYLTVTDAFSFSYTYNGHKFVVVTFPTANKTWTYDISTNLWHERESRDVNNNNLGRWRGNCVAGFNGRVVIGDAFSGQIGYLDPNTFTEFGLQMVCSATSPPIHSDRKRMFHSRFELDMQTGVGLSSGQGSDPQVMLDWSSDGGHSFNALQVWHSLGRQGEYYTRLRWLRLGQARQRIYRITISDPVPRVVISAFADISPGL